MKKRILSLLIAVLIALTSLPAWADSADGRGNTIVRNETLAAYVDGYGNLYIPGREQPVNDARADQIVSIDPYRLIFLSKTGEVGAEKSALISLDLTKMTETTVSSDVRAACVINSEDLYYIETANRTQSDAPKFCVRQDGDRVYFLGTDGWSIRNRGRAGCILCR